MNKEEQEIQQLRTELVHTLGRTICTVLSKVPGYIALEALTFNIGILLSAHMSPLQIEDFLDSFHTQMKKILGLKSENENKKRDPVD